MKKLVVFLLLASATCLAQSAFDGTWKADVSSMQLPSKPDVLLLQNGTFTCSSCIPEVSVKADGEQHPVSGHPGFDGLTVKVIDDHNISQTYKLGDRLVYEETDSISADGNTLTASGKYYPKSGSDKVVNSEQTSTRAAESPEGAHILSGSWHEEKVNDMSENGLIVTLKLSGNTLQMNALTGENYAAPLDGQQHPYNNSDFIKKVSLRRLGPNTIEESDYSDARGLESVTTYSVSDDGKTIRAASVDKVHGTTSAVNLQKQESMASEK